VLPCYRRTKRNPHALAANIAKTTAYITAAGTHDGKLAKCDGHRAQEPIIWEVTSRARQGWRDKQM